MIISLVTGGFDPLHSGHLALIRGASLYGDVCVGLNSDDSMKRIKREPVNDEEERKKVLESIAGVDGVILFDEDTPYELIKRLMPDCLVKGGDYTIDTVVGNDLVKQVKIIPIVEGKSTTKTIDKIFKLDTPL